MAQSQVNEVRHFHARTAYTDAGIYFTAEIHTIGNGNARCEVELDAHATVTDVVKTLRSFADTFETEMKT